MAVNKNFVVKNGLEVDTDLIFADASTNKVGIGSTIPGTELDIIGGIGATNLSLTGVATIPTGIVSTIVAHSAQIGNLNVSGITSLGDMAPSNIYVSGVTTTTTLDVIGTGNIRVGIITNVQGTNLEYSGIGTIASGIVTHLVANNLNVGGITSVRSGVATHLAVDNLNVGGITSVRSGVATHLAVNNLNVGGISSTRSGVVTHLAVNNLNVGGISSTRSGVVTHLAVDNLNVGGITSVRSGVVTHLAVNNLNVGGISTIGNFIVTKSAGGIGATVGANVGVITYYGDGLHLLNTGGGIGIGSTGSDGMGASGLVGYGFTFLSFVGTGVSDVLFNQSVGIATVWIAGGGGGSGNVSIGSEAPNEPSSGDLWYSTEYGRTFIWFDEASLGIGNTAVWVDSAPFNQGGKFINKYGDNVYGAIGYTGGTTSQASIYFSGDPNTGLIQPVADKLTIVAGGTGIATANVNGFEVAGIVTAGSFTGDGSGLTGVGATDNINTTKEAKLLGGVRMEGFTTSATMNVTGVSTFRGDISLIGSAAGVSSVTWDASARSLKFSDNAYAQFGDAQDLSIYHDSSNSIIDDSGSGSLKIQTDGTGVDIQKGSSETLAKFIVDGAVELYSDNVKTFETTTNGIIVQGTEGASANIYMYADEGDDNADKWVQAVGTDGDFTINNYGSGGWYKNILCSEGTTGNVQLYYNNTKRLETASDDAGGGVIVTGKVVGTAATIGTGVTINNTGIDAGIGAGIITASTYHGDGSNLTGIAAGGSGEFNTSISGATQYDVTTSMATAYTANASASHRTIVHSIHICNISASETSISGEIQSSFSLAHTIPVPAGSAVELLKQPKVLGPSETIELQAGANSALEATIIVEYKEDTDYWDAAVDITSASTLTDIYTSSSNPSVVQSILLANDNGEYDVKARVAWTDGSNNIQSYLCYDMIIPADSTVELCEKPKYLASGYKLRGYANVADRLEITASGKQITS